MFKKIFMLVVVITVLLSSLTIGAAFAADEVTWDSSTITFDTATLADDNLTIDFSGGKDIVKATKGVTSGKWYWEIEVAKMYCFPGVANVNAVYGETDYLSNLRGYAAATGWKYPGAEAYGEKYNVGDVIGIALDMDNYTIEFYKNGVSQGIAFTDLDELGTVYPFIASGSSLGGKSTANFGASTFQYSIPDGYIPYNGELPESPTNLTATSGDQEVTLTWDSVSDATSYNVKRSTNAGGPYTTVAESVYSTSYTDTSVTNGITYYYVVSTINDYGESENSSEVSATPLALQQSNAILKITMIDNIQKEYIISSTDVEDFISWYDNRIDGTGKGYYIFDIDKDNDPYNSRKEYLLFDKIICFEVMEY